ncbi:MAG: imidazole glycerol phosphate synthase subunit HisH [Syntrophaceae bacterium]|nr:imidazole glycerol phosphate synthase subunit HisH [Syntrophaceae bacterium]
MIVIVDYGMGNLRSVQKGFERIGANAIITRDPDLIEKADKVVLPGVGAFPECMKNLSLFGLIDSLVSFIKSDRPFLGICLGLQLLFDESEEFGVNKGLKIIPGKVKAFDRKMGLKIPHMGWNQVYFNKAVPIFNQISDGSWFYFVHSYYVDPKNVQDIAATANYGIDFTCAISRSNLFALQFHPEKSQQNGLKILSNFAKM